MSNLPLERSTTFLPDSFRFYWELLARYLGPLTRRVLWMGLLLLASISLALINPQVIRYFLDTAQAGGLLQKLLLPAGIYTSFAILQQATNLAADYTSQNVGWSATNRLRADLALHCLQLDMPFHKQYVPGELIERIDGDVTGLANFFSQFTLRVVGNGLLVIGILALLFRENAWLGLGMLAYTALTLAVLGQVRKLAVPRWTAVRQASAEQYGFLEERISGAEEIRALGAEPYVLRKLYELMRVFLQRVRAAKVVSSLAANLTNLIYVIGYAAGLALAVMLYSYGQASLGTAYLITYYVGMLGDPLQNIRSQLQDFQQATASLERVRKLFEIQPLDGNRTHIEKKLPDSALEVRFEHVSFCYEDNEDVLHDLSFTLQSGRVLGILGRTGSGKSTLSRLLVRLYDPNQGSLRLNGLDLRTLSHDELRLQVGLVTQEVQLFQATLRQNLTFFDPQVNDQSLQSALESLHLWDWATLLPDGLDTLVAAGGTGLSAGEAQLLAFARVLLRNPGVVILDEASSRLDPTTENRMEQAVGQLFHGRTGLVIAHRLKSVARVDDILILEGGRLVEYGPRSELAADRGSRFSRLLQTGLEEALA
jgi:ATP-binding cassette subfamily B protein